MARYGEYGYGQAGGGYRQGISPYAYQFPQQRQQQQESFFSPLPLEFVQGQFDRRQNEYDLSFAAALDTQDKLSQQMVGMKDMASKQQVINQSIQAMNDLVRDKHGGDWGAASKDIASKVVSARANPFWNASKFAEQQREMTRELKIKYGSNSMIFNDPTMKTVMDDEGRIRPPEEFQPDIIEKSDWLTTARGIMQGLAGNLFESGEITEEEYDYLSRNQLERLSPEKIRRISKLPEVRELFKYQSPDFRRLFEEGDDKMKQQFGVAGKDMDTAASDILAGAGLARQYSRTRTETLRDFEATAARDAARKYDPFETWTLMEEVITNAYPGAVKQRNMKFNEKGGIMTAEERMVSNQEPSMLSQLPIFTYNLGLGTIDPIILLAKEWELIKIGVRRMAENPSLSAPHAAFWGAAQLINNKREFFAKAAQFSDEEYYREIVEMHPYLSGYTPEKAIKLKQSADEKMMATAGSTKSFITERGVATNLHNALFGDGKDEGGDFFSHQIYLDGVPIAGDKKEKLFAKALGYSPDTEKFKEALYSSNVVKAIYTGNMPSALAGTITDSKGKEHTIEASGYGELGKVAFSGWSILEWIRSAGTSERLFKTVPGVQVDETGRGLYIPATQDFPEDVLNSLPVPKDSNGIPYPIYYHVTSTITSVEEGDQGVHNPKIQAVYFSGTDDILRNPIPVIDPRSDEPLQFSINGILDRNEYIANNIFYKNLRGTESQE